MKGLVRIRSLKTEERLVSLPWVAGHVRQFRYLAFDVGRDVCVANVVGFDAADVEVFNGPAQVCD